MAATTAISTTVQNEMGGIHDEITELKAQLASLTLALQYSAEHGGTEHSGTVAAEKKS